MRRWGLLIALIIGVVLAAFGTFRLITGSGRDALDSTFGSRIVYPEKVLLEDFQRPLDRDLTAQLIAFERTRLSEFLDRALFKPYLDDVRTQKLLAHGVELTPLQFPDRPDLHRIVDDCARILGIEKPRVLILDCPHPNAFTINIADPIVVLCSSLLRRFDDHGELRFIIGHEMGHIAARHVKWNTMLHAVTQYIRTSVPVPDELMLLPFLPLLRWSREAEMSADNAGLLCCQDLEAGERALLRLALNLDRDTIGKINVDAFLMQREREELSKFSEVMHHWYELQMQHPFIAERVIQLREYSKSPSYTHLWER